MKTKVIAVFLLLAFLAAPVFALDILFVNDTYVSATDSSDHSASASLRLIKSNGGDALCGSQFYGLVHNTSVNKILDVSNVTLYYTHSYYDGGGGTNPASVLFYFSPNAAWQDNMTYALRPNGVALGSPVVTAPFASTCVGLGCESYAATSQAFTLSNTTMIDRLYEGQPFTIYSCAGAVSGGAFPNDIRGYMNSSETSAYPYLQFGEMSYVTYATSNTDVPSTVYVDFETGSVSTQITAEYDVAIYPDVHYMLSYTAPQAFYSVEYDDQNLMSGVTCNGATYFAPQLVTNINQENGGNPNGRREIYCFNLSGNHAGQEFFGAIKFLNMSNVRGGSNADLDLFVSMYAPNYTSISTLTLVPGNVGEPIAALWSTSQSMNGTLYWRYRPNVTDAWSPYLTVQQNSNASTDHAVFIPASQSFAGYYEAYGYSCTPSECLQTLGVNTSVAVTPSVPSQEIGATQGIHIRVRDVTNLPLQAYVAFNNTPPVLTQLRPDNSSYSFFSQIASYYNFSNGVYPLQVYQSGFTSFNGTITVPSQPFIFDVTLTPFETCIEVYRTNQNGTCASNTRLITQNGILNYTSWYCAFDADACFLWDNATNMCTASGLWIGYGCLNNYHPAGFPVNGTAAIGSQGGLDGFFQVLGALFSVGTEGAKSMVAFLISLIVVAFMAIKTKDGLITSITFLVMIGVFASIGWIPIWLVIILAIASAFLIAKFVRQSFTPQ